MQKNVVHNVYCAFIAVAVCVGIAVIIVPMQNAHATTFPKPCPTFCGRQDALTTTNGYEQCMARCTRSLSEGALQCGTPVPNDQPTDVALEEEQCRDACFNVYSCIIKGLSDTSDEHLDVLFDLRDCLSNTCNSNSTIFRPQELPKLSDYARRIVEEEVAVRDAKTHGLCILKRPLSKGEAEGLLVRDITEQQITNVNIANIVIDTEERDVLCTYSSIKLVVRYLSFIVGIVTLIMILFAGFLWITSRGETEKISVAKKVLLAAIVGFIIVVIAQSVLRIIILL